MHDLFYVFPTMHIRHGLLSHFKDEENDISHDPWLGVPLKCGSEPGLDPNSLYTGQMLFLLVLVS